LLHHCAISTIGSLLGAKEWTSRSEVTLQNGFGHGAHGATHIPGNPPLPRLCISSIWRIIFFDPPPFISFIIFCICCGYWWNKNLQKLDYETVGWHPAYCGTLWQRDYRLAAPGQFPSLPTAHMEARGDTIRAALKASQAFGAAERPPPSAPADICGLRDIRLSARSV